MSHPFERILLATEHTEFDAARNGSPSGWRGAASCRCRL